MSQESNQEEQEVLAEETPRRRRNFTEEGLRAITQNLPAPDAWTSNPDAVASINLARRLRHTQHGLYASVPIICKGDACPYAQSCKLLQLDMAPYGELCPMEIAAIEDLFQRYCLDMNIDPNDPKQGTDVLMVRELIDIEVSMLRCDHKMAIDADFIIENTVGMTEDGRAITKQELHPATEYKEKLRQAKYKTLNLLNATRKDKEGTKIHLHIDPSEKAAEMLRVKKDMGSISASEDEAEKEYYRKQMERNRAPQEMVDVIDVQPIDYVE